LIQSYNTQTKFATADVLDSLWNPESCLRAQQEHRGNNRWKRVFTRRCVKDCAQYEECRKRRHHPPHDKVSDKQSHIRLNAD